MPILRCKMPFCSSGKRHVMNTSTFPIDAVYAWHDGNDPARVEKYHRACRDAAESPSKESISPARFVDNNELLFSLRSLEKFAPWINRVYIIVDQQRPKWINPEAVHFVELADILPATAAYPVFNSNLIELCMHRIEELSECFISLNDDFMIGNTIHPSDFFSSDSRPRIWYSKSGKTERLVKENMPDRKAAEIFSRTILYERYGAYYPHRIKHYPRAYTRKSMYSMWDDFPEDVERSLQATFRNNTNLTTYIFYPIYALATGQGVARQINGMPQFWDFLKGRVCHIGASLGDSNYRKKMQMIKILKPLTFCLNDSDSATDNDRKKLVKTLEEFYPKKSHFEK